MNKFLFVLLVAVLQNSTQLIAQQISVEEKLASTAKIWGFLKYYHPEVANGKFDWDDQLLKVLPKVKQANGKDELSKVYLDWIDSLGKVSPCRKCEQDKNQSYFDKNFDLSWINDSPLFSNELSEKLKYIENNRFQGRHHYVSVKYKQVGNISLKNEPEYPNLDWQDSDMRLLIAFKYWNVIEYFFPYKYQTDEPWDQVLLTSIPKLHSASTEKGFHRALQQMVVKIDDAHGWFIAGKTNYKWPLFLTKYVEDRIVVRDFYNHPDSLKSPLKIGDVVLGIDGEHINEIISDNKPYMWGSNKGSTYKNLKNFVIISPKAQKRRLKVLRGNDTVEVDVKYFSRDSLKPKKSKKWSLLSDSIGYVNMGKLTGKDVKIMMTSFRETRAIILDVRNYPKGALRKLASYLIPEERLFYKLIQPDLGYPGRFIWRDGSTIGNSKNRNVYMGKVIILVNEITQSRAELNVMAFQMADNVITIGSQTAGADGDTSKLELGGGIRTYMSGIGIFYPDGTETQRKGVEIDVEVHPTIEGIREGRDEVLEKAIELANN